MSEIKEYNDTRVQNSEQNTSDDFVYTVSLEFERDSRRYNRAFTEEREVGGK